MLFHEIKLANLLSFGPESPPIALHSLNVIVGANGSGKSNLLDAIALLQATPSDITRPIRQGGGLDDWIWKGSGHPMMVVASIEVEAELPSRLIKGKRAAQFVRHRFPFSQAFGDFISVHDERIEDTGTKSILYWREGSSHMASPRQSRERAEDPVALVNINDMESILAQIKDYRSFPELSSLADRYGEIRIYRDWVLGRNAPPRLPQPADAPNKWLEEDASNLGLVLNRLTRDLASKNKFLKYFRAVYEDARDFNVIVEGGRVQVFVQEEKFPVPATRLSDGTLRYLCLLAILLDPAPPPLICIDEPELGLHFDLINNIVDAMKDASERTQLIVTTHSDFMVDAFSDDPEAVLVCEKHNGSTTIQRLDPERMKVWLQKYRLGELWVSGEIGGKRW